MIDLYYWPTPNGHKVTILLEEAKLAYQIKPINIGKGEQFAPSFLAIAPNNRMPAIVDHEPAFGDEPLSLFESGAILLYLAEKSGVGLPDNRRDKQHAIQWLMWQMGGLGPMLGQNHHFNRYAPEKVPYAIKRYTDETARLYGVLNKQLADKNYLVGDDFTIADMACYPWIVPYEVQQQDIDKDFPNIRRWFDVIAARKSVQNAYAIGKSINDPSKETPQEAKERMRILFNHND